MIRYLSPLAYRTRPWKNGGGSTTEIAVHPEDAGWDDFVWRVGIAEIRRAGPFSSFPGIDRSIMLLEAAPGSGMTLTVDSTDIALPLHQFVDFSGEAVTHATLHGEAVRDLNVMSRRTLVRHRRGVAMLGDRESFRLGGSHWRVVYVAAGDVELMGAATPRRLGGGDSIVVEGDDALNLRSGRDGAKLAWAVFNHPPAVRE